MEGWTSSAGVTAGEPPTAAGKEASSWCPPLFVGDRIGRYSILRQVGAGGMGVVYAALDRTLDRRVAIKVLKTRSVRSEQRLLAEAKAMAALASPGIVEILDVGRCESGPFIVMSFVEGVTLDQWRRGDRTAAEILDVFERAGEALAGAHALGVVHRDVKPSNVMVDEAGNVHLLDFGLAVVHGLVELEEQVTVEHTSTTGSAPRRNPRRLFGTPRYMAPEQFLDRPVSAATDQFSFCTVLYEALYGRHPFRTGSLGELQVSIVRQKPAPAGRRRGVPRRIEQVLRRGLSKRPEQRYESMPDLLDALRIARRSERRRLLPATVAAGVFTAAVPAVIAWQAEPSHCDQTAHRFDAAWDEHARDAARTGLGHTHGELAGRVWQRVEPRLDTAVREHARAFAQACTLPVQTEFERHHRDETLACLERAQSDLTRAIRALTSIEPDSADAAVHQALTVTPRPRC